MKCAELIVNDHLILRRGLNIFDGMVRKLEDGARIEIADVSAVLKFLRCFGDEYHQAMEEQFLFPALMAGPIPGNALSQMTLEHSTERALVAGIEDALRSKRGMEFARTSRQLLVVLRDHLDKEDSLLRLLPGGSLSSEQDDRVTAGFTGNRIPPESFVNFSRLEWKYTPKPRVEPLAPAASAARAHSAGYMP
jgi:hemerythrin-like domain-containing protein